MEYKIVNHENKYLFILDTKPTGFKKGEWMFNEPDNSEILYQFTYDIEQYPIGNKVLAHLPINGSSNLDSCLLLPELDEPYGKIIKEEYYKGNNNLFYSPIFISETESFAKELRAAPAIYTAEEMLKAMDEMYEWSLDAAQYDDKSGKAMILDKITRAKYPISFVTEMITYKNSFLELVVKGDWIK